MLEKVKGNIYESKRKKNGQKRISFANDEPEQHKCEHHNDRTTPTPDQMPSTQQPNQVKIRKIKQPKKRIKLSIKKLHENELVSGMNTDDSRNSIKIDSKDMIDFENY